MCATAQSMILSAVFAVGFAACALGETITAEPVISSEPTLITTREGLAAIANDLAGSYALGADIDLGGADAAGGVAAATKAKLGL